MNATPPADGRETEAYTNEEPCRLMPRDAMLRHFLPMSLSPPCYAEITPVTLAATRAATRVAGALREALDMLR